MLRFNPRRWAQSLFEPRDLYERHRGPLPPIAFPELEVSEQPPANSQVAEARMYLVRSHERSRWLIFLCPCGCKNVITLSLQKIHRPHWLLRQSRNVRPSLYPSVWRDVGCHSHFWISDGRVFWCGDTGTDPRMR
jgi:hypothetical protein